MKNYYEELEVSKNASNEVISRAYKVLAKKYHPDTTNENKQLAEERFKKISEAYEVLSNDQKRAEYDKTLQPEISADKYNKILEDNRQLAKELANLKSQLNSIKNNRTSSGNSSQQNFSPPSNTSHNYNTNSNYNQYNYKPNYYQQRTQSYNTHYSFLDRLKFKLKELGKKIFAILLTILIISIAIGILYIIPSTRKFLIYDLQLGSLFSLFK